VACRMRPPRLPKISVMSMSANNRPKLVSASVNSHAAAMTSATRSQRLADFERGADEEAGRASVMAML